MSFLRPSIDRSSPEVENEDLSKWVSYLDVDSTPMRCRLVGKTPILALERLKSFAARSLDIAQYTPADSTQDLAEKMCDYLFSEPRKVDLPVKVASTGVAISRQRKNGRGDEHAEARRNMKDTAKSNDQRLSYLQRAGKHRVFLSFGSNLGDRVDNIERALLQLENRNIAVVGVSSLWQTAPMYMTDQGSFLNGVCEVRLPYIIDRART